MYELKEMLERELKQIVNKGDITPQDLDKIKDASEAIYYITAACAMEEGYGNEEDYYSGRRSSQMNRSYSNAYMPNYYSSNNSGRRNSRGQYSRDNYSGHDMESKREFLEEMLREARSESEREMFRQKLEELNRQMM